MEAAAPMLKDMKASQAPMYSYPATSCTDVSPPHPTCQACAMPSVTNEQMQEHDMALRASVHLGNERPQHSDVEHLKIAPGLIAVEVGHIFPERIDASKRDKPLSVNGPCVPVVMQQLS